MEFRVIDVHWDNGDQGTRLEITMWCGNTQHTLKFVRRAASDIERDFVSEQLWVQFENHIAEIRKEAYEAGWRDKTKRKKKATWFEQCANRTDFY